MRRALALLIALASAGAFAQAKPGTPPSAAATRKAEGAAPEQKPEEKKARPPLDVRRLPFTPESIKQVVTYHQDGIQTCYEEWLAGQQNPVDGSLMTSFTITPTGAVREARVLKQGTTLGDAKFHACVASVLEAMTFPKPDDGDELVVEFPFNLKSSP
jgi:hypothetical protein